MAATPLATTPAAAGPAAEISATKPKVAEPPEAGEQLALATPLAESPEPEARAN
jgi:hypothetical protein